MLNISRSVQCPHCHYQNRWKGNPGGHEVLYCRHCEATLCTYDEYIRQMVRHEVARIMVQYTDPDSDSQLELLKRVLCDEAEKYK
ncbi:hypothetical protein SAMN04487959_108128 [Modicisalibacter xianhensis]|uniref:Uncharacterized protein n=1 Tax=Modicisalibacter xianhensis TaxID=442341 RepID=A0A1I3CBX2_9GAMM|nr:hypothetical protein SAMN04487959_108128 [Halomonas xianhensis]